MYRLAALLLLLALPAAARDMTYLVATTPDAEYILGTYRCQIRQSPSSWSVAMGKTKDGREVGGCWSPRNDGGVTLHFVDPKYRTIEIRAADVRYETAPVDGPEDVENLPKSSV